MKDLTDLAIDIAIQFGASYADIRIVELKHESIYAKNHKISYIKRSEDLGFGVRVISDGAWGFASSNKLSRSEIERVVSLAIKIAKASSSLKLRDVKLALEKPHNDFWQTPFIKDPFKVSLQVKTDLLLKINEELCKVKAIKVADSGMNFIQKHQFFASTEGNFIEQNLIFTGVGYAVTAVGKGDLQRRSYPFSFGGQYMSKGYELIEELPLLENTQKIAEEAAALLVAKPCPNTTTDLILGGSQLAIQIHESIGHAVELDRVLGEEANFAGTSFATPDKLGKLQYASPIVNVVADSTTPNGLATAGYDDEGTAAQKWDIIKDGIFVDYFTSRETALVIGEKSRGAMRASGYDKIPIIRMPNLSLRPANWKLEDLIADTDEGLYLDTNKSWSIDQKRINFQFAAEIGYRIKSGKIVEMVKNPSYQGMTTQFWNSCDAICNSDHFVLWGVNNCGKGEPSQPGRMSHGAAPARFRKVKVGVADV